MQNRSLISSNQIALLIAGSALMFPYTFLPIVRTAPANQDVWLVEIVTIFFVIIINVPLLFIINKFRGFDLNEANEIIMGRVGGIMTSAVFLLMSLFCVLGCMSIAALYVQSYLLVETPLWVILLFILTPVTFSSIKGAGTICRMALITVPLMLLTIVIFFIAGIPDMDECLLKPIFKDSSFIDIILGAVINAARYSEIIILFAFSYHLKKSDKINTTYFKGITLYSIFFFIMTISTILMLGSDIAKISNNPFLAYTRQVGSQEFLQRVHLLNISAWFIGVVVKLSAYNYMASHIFSRIIRAKTHKYFVFPMAILVFIIGLLPFMRKMSTIHKLTSDYVFPVVVLFTVFVVPLVLCLVYLIRKKKINKIINLRIKKKDKQTDDFYKEKASVQAPKKATVED